jgi:hypothetical protein
LRNVRGSHKDILGSLLGNKPEIIENNRTLCLSEVGINGLVSYCNTRREESTVKNIKEKTVGEKNRL